MSERNVNAETLDFLIEYVQGAPEQQELHADSISTRAGQVFAAGTVLLGLTAATASDLHSALVGASVVAYVAAAGCAFMAIKHRPIRVSSPADRLWNLFCDQPPETAKRSIIADISSGYAENRETLRVKRRWAERLLLALGAQAFSVGAGLFISLF